MTLRTFGLNEDWLLGSICEPGRHRDSATVLARPVILATILRDRKRSYRKPNIPRQVSNLGPDFGAIFLANTSLLCSPSSQVRLY